MADESDKELLGLTATIVSAHIRNNHVAANALPELIQSVHRSLAAAGTAEPAPAQAAPASLVRNDPSAIPAEVGVAGRLPHGGAELRQPSRKPREAERPRPEAEKRGSGTNEHGREQ